MSKKDDLTWRLLMVIPAGVLLFIGLAFLATGGSDRGTPSRIVLMNPGCELVRLAGSRIEVVRSDGTCVIRGYVRKRVFSSDLLIDLGGGMVLDIGGHQVAGHLSDESFDAPLGPNQLLARLIGIGILVTAAGIMVFTFWPFGRRSHIDQDSNAGQ